MSCYQEVTDLYANHELLICDPNTDVQHQIFPLLVTPKTNTPATSSKQGFANSFDHFSIRALENINWENMVVAGGSVLACVMPVPDDGNEGVLQSTSPEKYFREHYKTSDIDIFLYKLTKAEAMIKLNHIYETIFHNMGGKVISFRTKNTFTIAGIYPFRSMQIILRIYPEKLSLSLKSTICACV